MVEQKEEKTMAEPVVAKRHAYIIVESPGERWWCACGRSKSQPYCDGSHDGTGIKPIPLVIEEARKVAWCGCKQTRNPPCCDGSHSMVPPPLGTFRPQGRL
jgi:CDGSH iron-sulfur domain-containing protein 3